MRVLLLSIVYISNCAAMEQASSHAMEVARMWWSESMLKDDACKLKKDIAYEASGHYDYHVVDVEKEWKNASKGAIALLIDEYQCSQETQQIMQRLINRSDDRAQLMTALLEHKFDNAQKIVDNNPYVLHAYNRLHNYDHEMFEYEIMVIPLHEFVVQDDKKNVAWLLKNKSNSNACVYIHDYTPLYLARSKSIAKLLVKYGAIAQQSENSRCCPLVERIFGKYVCKRSVPYDVLHYLFKHKVDINIPIDQAGNTLLHREVRGNNYDGIVFLLQHGANPHQANYKGVTPLQDILYGEGYAAFQQCGLAYISPKGYSVIDLLQNGAEKFHILLGNTHYIGADGATQTMINNVIAQLCITLKRGALHCNKNKANNCTCGGDWMLHKIIIGERNPYITNIKYISLQELAGKKATQYIAKHLYSQAELGYNFSTNFRRLYDRAKLREVIAKRPYAVAYDKNIAWQIYDSLMQRDMETFEWVLEGKCAAANGTQCMSDLSGTDEHGNTLMHQAIERKNAKAINLLIKHGVNLAACNINAKSALDLLYEIKDQQCIDAFHDAFIQKYSTTPSYVAEYKNLKEFLRSKPVMKLCEQSITLLEKNAPIKEVLTTIPVYYLIAAKAHKALALLLQRKICVSKKMIDYARNEAVCEMLQSVYDEQECCICCERSKDLSNIPCIGIHTEAICKACYDVTNKTCPLCRRKLDDFGW